MQSATTRDPDQQTWERDQSEVVVVIPLQSQVASPATTLSPSPTKDRNEAINQFLEDAGRGDEQAFGSFYDAMSALVYGIVLKIIRDPAMAEEVTQEIFLEVWRVSPRYDPSKGSAKSWTATVAHRRAVDRVRSEASHRSREEKEHQHVPAPRDEVSVLVQDRFERTRVAECLNRLSETQREAVTLAYFGGHTYREVARLLDVPEGTIKTRIRDGLIKLRKDLEVSM